MRVTSIMSAAATAIIMFAASSQVCSAQVPNYNGIWTGVTNASSNSSSASIEVDLAQSGTTLSGTARITQGLDYYAGTVTGSAATGANLNINFGAYGTMAAALNVSGGFAVGSYSLATGTDPVGGTVALTLQPEVTPTDISGLYIGTNLDGLPGAGNNECSVFIIQTGDSIYFSSLWDDTYVFNGSGTIIGNKITFQVTPMGLTFGNTKVINGSATINGKVISGITLTGGGGGSSSLGAFSVSFIMGVY